MRLHVGHHQVTDGARLVERDALAQRTNLPHVPFHAPETRGYNNGNPSLGLNARSENYDR